MRRFFSISIIIFRLICLLKIHRIFKYILAAFLPEWNILKIVYESIDCWNRKYKKGTSSFYNMVCLHFDKLSQKIWERYWFSVKKVNKWFFRKQTFFKQFSWALIRYKCCNWAQGLVLSFAMGNSLNLATVFLEHDILVFAHLTIKVPKLISQNWQWNFRLLTYLSVCPACNTQLRVYAAWRDR